MRTDVERITSRQNSLLVEVHKLSDRKHRVRSRLFRFDGVKLTCEALCRDVRLHAVLLRESNADAVWERVHSTCGKAFPESTRVVCVADHAFDALSEESAPEGVICVAHMQSELHAPWKDAPPAKESIMLLESVRDPSNLGAIIRSAAAFGIDRLIVSDDCADLYNAKTVRASMGTLFSQRIDRASDLAAAVELLKASGRRVFAAALDENAERLGEFPINAGDCAVIGNEGHGLSDRVIAACGRAVYIPMTERAESLNAAVAASVLMWTFSR